MKTYTLEDSTTHKERFFEKAAAYVQRHTDIKISPVRSHWRFGHYVECSQILTEEIIKYLEIMSNVRLKMVY
jgi:hypothetical protein